MASSKNTKTEIKWTIGIILVTLILIGLTPEFYAWFSKDNNGLWIKSLYKILNGRSLVNIPICLIIIYFVCNWCLKIFQDNEFKSFRFTLIAIGLIFTLLWERQLIYARVIWDIDYKSFIIGLQLISLLMIPINTITKRVQNIRRKKEEHRAKGFSNTVVNNQNTSKQNKNFAALISKKLKETNIKEQSYAVGVVGKWGVGKTTFLNQLKNHFKDDAELVEFNPWMCRTPQLVIQDFFSSLRHQLSPKYSHLSKSIIEYANSFNLEIAPFSVFGIKMSLPIKGKSLHEKKLNLSQKLSQLPKPVIVLIDDIDRLEREEVFEVLRLIRNTADLKNTIYIVTYDKEYVTCVLEEKKIMDASSYLEKIFPLEILLPKVEDYEIWDTFCTNIKNQDNLNLKFSEKLFDHINKKERTLILQVLCSFRSANRFANLYMLNVTYMNKNLHNEIKYMDLLWLLLLQVYDKKAYDILAYDRDFFLYNKDETLKLKKWILQDAPENDVNIWIGKKLLKKKTPKILDMMFGEHTNSKTQSICYTNNYNKYFTLIMSSSKLSIQERNELFKENANPNDVVMKWLISGKHFSSISFQLQEIAVNTLNNNQIISFFQGLLCFGIKIISYRNSPINEVKQLLQTKKYNDKTIDIANKAVKTWIDEKLIDEKEIINLSKLLNYLYITIYYDENRQEEKIFPLIISNDEIEVLLVKIMDSYLNNHNELTALDVMKKENTLGILFKNNCLKVDYYHEIDKCFYTQFAYETIITHFSKKETKPSIKEYKDSYTKMFKEPMPVFDNYEDEHDYINHQTEKEDWNYQKYFGDNKDKLIEFKTKCFMLD